MIGLTDIKNKVIDNFISEYKEGRTPNPCIRCNQYVKFEHLLDKADELGAQYISTGHYAIIKKGKALFELHKAKDKTKDQSYALYSMNQKALSRTLFPLGGITKIRTRKLAKELGLSVADKKDSQEICFVEDNNYNRFLTEHAPECATPGPIMNSSGKKIGTHKGIAFYTIGQRKGLNLNTPDAYYVTKIVKENNSIVVGNVNALLSKELISNNIIWTSVIEPNNSFKAKAKIRYSAEFEDAIISPAGNGTAKVDFINPIKSITPGQSVVFYKNSLVIGGGIIC